MKVQSHLIKQTANGILATLFDFQEGNNVVLKKSTLAKKFNVSRTTISSALTELEKKGIVEITGSQKRVLRAALKVDYFDTSNSVLSKVEIVEKYFLGLINQGKLLPGDVFSEIELARASGCNTITVREFLFRFSRFGLIKKNPRARWQMVDFDEKFALELIDFKRLLEFGSITKLLEVPEDEAVWDELSKLLDRHLEVLGDVENRHHELGELERTFHNIVQSASNNRFFLQFFEVISLNCHYHYQWDKGDALERSKIALEEHIAIMTHLIAHNTSGVIKAMETHLNTAKKTLLSSANALADMYKQKGEEST